MAKEWGPIDESEAPQGDWGHFSAWPFEDVERTQKLAVRILIGVFFSIVLGSIAALVLLKPLLNKF
jgi:hypothetical protein